jgi:crotonobetainyl-CoA:carnitine CoA-transferase CaiB-like acyl-CoA transferase
LTKDGKRVVLAIGNDRQFKDLIATLGISDHVLDLGAWALEVKFLSNQQRVENRLQLNELLEKAIVQFESKELMSKIYHLKIPAGLIQNVKEAFSTDAAKEILLTSAESLGVKNFIGLVSSIESRTSTLLPPPHFGEHTEEILSS